MRRRRRGALAGAGAAVDERGRARRARRGRRPASTTSRWSPTREAERRAELAELAPQVLDVPSLDSDVHDLAGLMTLARSPAHADDPRRPLDQADSTSMASLAALVRDNTTLDRDQVSHLNRLTSEWGMLADFCFADLLLYVPTKDDRWLIVGQVRPATGQTVYHTDWVGSLRQRQRAVRALVGVHVGRDHRGRRRGRGRSPTRPGCSPSRCAATAGPSPCSPASGCSGSGRPPGELERTYVSIFDRFAEMIAEGSFPYPTRGADSTAAPASATA